MSEQFDKNARLELWDFIRQRPTQSLPVVGDVYSITITPEQRNILLAVVSPAQPHASKPLGWCLLNDAGKMWWDEESCIWWTEGDAAQSGELEQLKNDEPDNGWQVAPFYATPVSATGTPRAHIPLDVRPLLVRGMLAADARGPRILINSEESDPMEQVVSLFHELLHLVGLTDEFLAEEYATRLADAAPDILRRLAHVINVPEPTPPSHAVAPQPSSDARAVAELANIVNARRFDREAFRDDTEFADWAQSRCKYVLADTLPQSEEKPK